MSATSAATTSSLMALASLDVREDTPPGGKHVRLRYVRPRSSGCSATIPSRPMSAWDVDAKPDYAGNGGHGQLFRGFDGALRYILHRPGFSQDRLERVVALDFDENGPRLIPRNEAVA